MKINFGTKAETLERLSTVLTTAKILPQIRMTVAEWHADPHGIMERIRNDGWFDTPLIVRSSALAEDSEKESLAGHFTSISNAVGEKGIYKAVCRVIESYASGNGSNQIFIQPMLQNVTVSGVVFSKDPNNGAPYIVINYDDITGSTDSVTSGQSNELKTFLYHKFADTSLINPLDKVVTLVRELEDIFITDTIDLEFAVTSDNELYLLQVRPLIIHQGQHVDKELHKNLLEQIYSKICQANKPHPYLYGSRTIFGVMPDWNPAEIIGVRPRPLALSLYKEIITDNIWAYQRNNYGYRNLRSFPLLLSFHGLPYIDVRVDFNSFIPADVENDMAERLVNYYIDRLIKNPSLHDKVEFEIVYSCYTLDLHERLKVLDNYGFSEKDCDILAESLRCLTNKIIHAENGLWCEDIKKIKVLETRREIIKNSSLDTVSKIYWLLEDCKRYGTLPFAGLARAGFIAVQLLKSLVNAGVLTQQEYDNFMGTLDTISSQMRSDFENLSRKAFLAKYGHLRPGTYDILSSRYDEEPDRYFDWMKSSDNLNHKTGNFALSLPQLKHIERILKEQGLDHDVIRFLDFIKAAIEGREYAKFVFTQSLSDAMSLFKSMGAEYGYTVEECSFADISCIKELYSSSADVSLGLRKSIDEGKGKYAVTKQIVLPPLITRPEDVWAFHLPPSEPNYITLKAARGHTTFANDEKTRLCDSILFIPSADPGYDWIFSNNIAGFITMYGGVNSHMAIRAAELGVPAVIGTGEALYNRWAAANLVKIDCANREVQVLQ